MLPFPPFSPSYFRVTCFVIKLKEYGNYLIPALSMCLSSLRFPFVLTSDVSLPLPLPALCVHADACLFRHLWDYLPTYHFIIFPLVQSSPMSETIHLWPHRCSASGTFLHCTWLNTSPRALSSNRLLQVSALVSGTQRPSLFIQLCCFMREFPYLKECVSRVYRSYCPGFKRCDGLGLY